ncbi:MAG: hypothetical protein Q9172_002984 [Xanthocarpia lactea]
MLIGLCGSILAGKQSVATYLVECQGFSRLHLAPTESTTLSSSSAATTHHTTPSDPAKAPEPEVFSKVDELVDYITKRWQQRWVTTDIWNETVLEKLLRRPSFFLVSVDAPLSLRWRRCRMRCASLGQPAPSLEEFVERNDDHLYDQNSGLARLIDRAEVRLVNRSDDREQLHQTLEELDLPNEQRLRPNWDQYFMQLASLAAQRSNCMKRRVGCVLVREKRVISTGYNGTPRNLKNCNEGGCSRCNDGTMAGVGLSTCLCIHAEENALLEAGRERIREGIKITQVGISEVVYSQGYGMDTETAAVFAEGGVKLRQFSPVGAPLMLVLLLLM